MSILYHWAALMLQERQRIARFDGGTAAESDGESYNAELAAGVIDNRMERARAAQALLLKEDDTAPASHFALVDAEPTLRDALHRDREFAAKAVDSSLPLAVQQEYLSLSAAVAPQAWFPDFTSGALAVLAENEPFMRGFRDYDPATASELVEYSIEEDGKAPLEAIQDSDRARRFLIAYRETAAAMEEADLPVTLVEKGERVRHAIDKALNLVADDSQKPYPVRPAPRGRAAIGAPLQPGG